MDAMELMHYITESGESREGLGTSIDHISKYMSRHRNGLSHELGKALMRYVMDRNVDKCVDEMVMVMAREIGG